MPSSMPNADYCRVSKGAIIKNQKYLTVGDSSSIPVEFKRFLLHIETQIKGDEHFRKIKQWFQRLKVDTKWTVL